MLSCTANSRFRCFPREQLPRLVLVCVVCRHSKTKIRKETACMQEVNTAKKKQSRCSNLCKSELMRRRGGRESYCALNCCSADIILRTCKAGKHYIKLRRELKSATPQPTVFITFERSTNTCVARMTNHGRWLKSKVYLRTTQ